DLDGEDADLVLDPLLLRLHTIDDDLPVTGLVLADGPLLDLAHLLHGSLLALGSLRRHVGELCPVLRQLELLAQLLAALGDGLLLRARVLLAQLHLVLDDLELLAQLATPLRDGLLLGASAVLLQLRLVLDHLEYLALITAAILVRHVLGTL